MIDNITVLLMGIAVFIIALRAVRFEQAERATRLDGPGAAPSNRS